MPKSIAVPLAKKAKMESNTIPGDHSKNSKYCVFDYVIGFDVDTTKINPLHAALCEDETLGKHLKHRIKFVE